jgi:hypothetical protein
MVEGLLLMGETRRGWVAGRDSARCEGMGRAVGAWGFSGAVGSYGAAIGWYQPGRWPFGGGLSRPFRPQEVWVAWTQAVGLG